MNQTRTRPTSLYRKENPLAAGFTVQNLDGAYSLYKIANPEGVKYGNEYQHG